MGVRLIPLMLALTAFVSVAINEGFAVSLGKLQAMPGVPPPYVFRIAIRSHPHTLTDAPAVTVHQPRTALSLVKNDTLELRLQSLTDVEFEVSHGGQTLNRLLMKRELQAAHARLEAATAWSRYEAAKANRAPSPQAAALLDGAYKAHQTWGQLDPAASRQGLHQVLEERQRFLVAHSKEGDPVSPWASQPPTAPTLDGPVANVAAGSAHSGVPIEPELQVIRQEMSELMARVTLWGDVDAPLSDPEAREAIPLLGLFLAGGLLVASTSLLTAFVMQRGWSTRATERHRHMPAMNRQLRRALSTGDSEAVNGQLDQHPAAQRALQDPAYIAGRVRVSQKRTRLIRLKHLPSRPELPLAHPVGQSEISLRNVSSRALTPTALIEALEHLRQDLVNLQNHSLSSCSPESSDRHVERRGR
jgi:hypothetical protein